MADESQNKLTLDLTDKRLWAIVLALAGVQFGAGQLGSAGVAATAEKAVEESAAKTRDETQEQIRDLKEAVEVKREREPRR